MKSRFAFIISSYPRSIPFQMETAATLDSSRMFLARNTDDLGSHGEGQILQVPDQPATLILPHCRLWMRMQTTSVHWSILRDPEFRASRHVNSSHELHR